MTFKLKLHGKKKGVACSKPVDRDFIRLKVIGENLTKFPKNINGLFMDPGGKNFAICQISNGKVIGSQMLANPLYEIKGATYGEVVNKFIQEISNIINTVRPDVLVIERFVIRGFGANIVELVGQMIGVIKEMCRWKGILFNQIMSGQWKRKITPFVDLKELYKLGKKQFKLPPHQIDAMLIGRYTLNGNSFNEKDVKWIHSSLKNCCKPIIKGI